MKRLLDNLHVDVVAGFLMIGMLATGYILRFPLPPGSNKALSLWGLTRHGWGSVHFWISLVLLAVVLLHVALHWNWIVITLKRRLGAKSASPGSPIFSGVLAFLTLVAMLVLFGWVAQTNVKPITEPMGDVCLPEKENKLPQESPPIQEIANRRSHFGAKFIPFLNNRACRVTGRQSSGGASVRIAERIILGSMAALPSSFRERVPKVR